MLTRRRTSSVAVLLTLLAATGCGDATPEISEEPLGSNSASFLMSDVMISGVVGRVTPLGFLAFDLASLPKNMRVESAELELSFAGDGAGLDEVRFLGCWGGWDCNNPSVTAPRNTKWQDVAAVTHGTNSDRFDVTGLMTDWLSGGCPNHGFAFHATDSFTRYHSSDSGSPNAPRLVVTYRPAP